MTGRILSSNVLALFIIFMLSFPVKSAEICADIDHLSCFTSTKCMLIQDLDEGPYHCAAPTDQCQVQFRQGFLSASGLSIELERGAKISAACEAREGCEYIPMGKCFCPPGVVCFCGGGTPPNCLTKDAQSVTEPSQKIRKK
jgi:hypothetical protein